MENINIADFISYFGSYYPVIIPVLITLLIISSYVLDLIRAWCIKYVDEGESGPYKMYVVPFLSKLFGIEEPLAKHYRVSRGYCRDITGYFTSTSISTDRKRSEFWHKVVMPCGKAIWVEYEYRLQYLRKVLKEYPNMSYKDLIDIARQGINSPLCETGEDECEPSLLNKLIIVLVLIMSVLTAYKLLPEITVGAVVAYGVLRVARSVVRLTKRFNKHISDGHGAQTTEDVSNVK